MSPVLAENTVLAEVEHELANGIPFGRHEAIAAALAPLYVRMLAAVAPTIDGAKRLLDRVADLTETQQRSAFRDCLIRRVIEDSVCTVLQGIPAPEPEQLQELLTAAAQSPSVTLLGGQECCTPLTGLPNPTYLWAGRDVDSEAGRRFQQEVQRRMPGLEILVPAPEEKAAIQGGLDLAQQTLPHLAASALAHCFLVMVGQVKGREHTFHSLTIPGLPGLVLLSPSAIKNSIDAAEAMFHESLHLKFLDIDYVHPLFAVGFRQSSSPKVTPVWHRDKPGYGGWPVDRVLTSMHVYTSLALYHRSARTVGSPPARAEQCWDRAKWLFDAAQEHLDQLSPSGKSFVDFVGAAIGGLRTQSTNKASA
jgi:hypothetical protein